MNGLTMKYFILKPKSKSRNDKYAEASRKAMRAYANHIQSTNPELHRELWNWANEEHDKSFDFDKSEK